MGRRMLALLAASLLFLLGEGRDLKILPIPTPQGLAAEAGFSPRPTDPPGSVPGVPRELLQRQNDDLVEYPAPGWYCGLVSGQEEWPLSCIDARANCIFAGTAVGCCFDKDTRRCATAIATTCVDSSVQCPECEIDSRIMHCTRDTSSPYCGTYSFGGRTSLVGCYNLQGITESVMEMSEYFSSVYGSDYTTIGPDTSPDDTPTETESSRGPIETASETETETSDPIVTTTPDSSDGDGDHDDDDGDDEGDDRRSTISGGAIAGIVVGVVAVVAAFAGFIAWLMFKRKRENAAATASGAAPGPTTDPSTYGQPQPAGASAGFYDPKPAMVHEASAYQPCDPKHQSIVSSAPTMSPVPGSPPPVSEMPGSPTALSEQQRHMSGVPVSPNSGSGNMSATMQGPLQDYVHEIGPSR